MSAEMLMALSAFLTLGIGMFAGFGWMAHRIDASARRLDSGIDKVETSLGTRIDKLDSRIDRLDARIDTVISDLTDVKVSVARMESTRPRLLAAE